MATHSLTSAEELAARQVLSGSIQYYNVRVRDDLGLGGKPWGSPASVAISPYSVLHAGPALPGIVTGYQCLPIHELTHVWQGQHGVPKGYVLNTAHHQAIAGITNSGDAASNSRYVHITSRPGNAFS